MKLPETSEVCCVVEIYIDFFRRVVESTKKMVVVVRWLMVEAGVGVELITIVYFVISAQCSTKQRPENNPGVTPTKNNKKNSDN